MSLRNDASRAADRSAQAPVPTPRLAVICDYPEEGWTSMDLVAEMLLRELRRGHAGAFQAVEICPPFFRLATRIPAFRSTKTSLNIDRILNRWRCYPRALRRLASDCEWHHVCDHSYAHLIHELPAGRSGV